MEGADGRRRGCRNMVMMSRTFPPCRRTSGVGGTPGGSRMGSTRIARGGGVRGDDKCRLLKDGVARGGENRQTSAYTLRQAADSELKQRNSHPRYPVTPLFSSDAASPNTPPPAPRSSSSHHSPSPRKCTPPALLLPHLSAAAHSDGSTQPGWVNRGGKCRRAPP